MTNCKNYGTRPMCKHCKNNNGICDNYKENQDAFFEELKKYVREKSKAYYERALIIKKCAYPKIR